MGLSVKKLLTVVICFILVCPVIFVTGCGEEKAEYLAFWELESPGPHKAHKILNLYQNQGTGNLLKNSYVEVAPDSEKTIILKIWNRHETPGIKTTYRISSNSEYVTFPKDKIETISKKRKPGIAYVESGVNIRSNPTTESEILYKTIESYGFLIRSQKVSDHDSRTWIEIELEDGGTGWVRSDLATLNLDFDLDDDNTVDIPVNIKLPKEITLPVEVKVKITPSNGESQILNLMITEADWWSVNWVASGTVRQEIDLYEWKRTGVEFEITNHSDTTSMFHIFTSDKSLRIDTRDKVKVSAGKKTKVCATIYTLHKDGIDENTKFKETITIKGIDNYKDDEEEQTSDFKKIHLSAIHKKLDVDVFWDETGTDTITVELLPYEFVLKNIKIVNHTDQTIDVGNSKWLEASQTLLIPTLILNSKSETQVEISGRSFPLKINHVIKKPVSNVKSKTDRKISKNCIFTQYSDKNLFTLINDNMGNRKIECFDIISGELLWVYPKKDHPEYDIISKTLLLKDVSTAFDKVIVQYNLEESKYPEIEKNVSVCLDVKNGEMDWYLKGNNFLSVFGSTDRFVVDCGYRDECGNQCKHFECRKLTTNEVLWEKNYSELESFGYADNDYAYFFSSEEGTKGGRITADTPPEITHETCLYWPGSYLHSEFPWVSSANETTMKWPEESKKEFDKLIESFFGSATEHQTFVTENGLVVAISDYYSTEMFLFDKDSGETIAAFGNMPKNGDIDFGEGSFREWESNYYYNKNVSYYNIEGEILEMGGYFFKLPEKEYIDLPNTYHLQHYSETTGKYYFLDMDGGQVVCVSLQK